ncbi:bifunctional 3,4-dihydroxy-2-butanone-4-phosphate synthase/GTP cyclohydrolase II [Nitrosococcus oceani]|uniref:bifunctional 3,4-dihydroxy-2-butanone-4-phosphate synthase/GTP cyclohydrolase II n=1 Tax=Nitrosococcus oceani TaxID=1229 RepID=UPI0004E8DB97|nr:bifunctional 3,4-dihydroxy-2-butanone-4-phosphate synthase/GTP cyclohydrolase II [Nitrosococcus oceani]KFI22305.1 3,4-dihydroxy-2-butanone 4-phosphate synthase [Nitrosococcus oceani]
MPLSKTEAIIQDLREGKMVILMDDEDRENEGDLIMAASQVRAPDINFMARYGRGLICLTLTEARCRQLRLPLMVSDSNAKYSTNFTVSIEAATGVTTGISAADRARTVQAAVAPEAHPEDLEQPGHIFPLMARPGGVLTRAGHTEAGCDLARLAGFEPAAVIVEILNEDGSMARRPDLEVFAERHGLKLGTIADLIRYRLEHERSVARVAECALPTEQGLFRLLAYQDLVDQQLHLALVRGELCPEEPALVRVHMADTLCDILQVRRGDCGWPLHDAMTRIAKAGTGVVVILRRPESSSDLVQRIQDYNLEDQGERLPRQEPPNDLRTYGVGAQILTDLGVQKMRVMSAPRRMHGLAGFGLEVVDYVT